MALRSTILTVAHIKRLLIRMMLAQSHIVEPSGCSEKSQHPNRSQVPSSFVRRTGLVEGEHVEQSGETHSNKSSSTAAAPYCRMAGISVSERDINR